MNEAERNPGAFRCRITFVVMLLAKDDGSGNISDNSGASIFLSISCFGIYSEVVFLLFFYFGVNT
jgi:hypothetical protein